MNRDYLSDIDRLGRQLSDLRAIFARQAGDSADDAAAYIAPRARQFARQFRHEGHGLAAAARHNPSAATGAVLGALAIGAAVGLLLAGSSRRDY